MAGSYWHQHPCPAFQSSAAISWWKRAPWLFCLSGNYLRQKGNANFLGRSKCCSISQPETRSFWMNLIRKSRKVAWTMPGNLRLVGKQSDLWPPNGHVFGLNSTHVQLQTIITRISMVIRWILVSSRFDVPRTWEYVQDAWEAWLCCIHTSTAQGWSSLCSTTPSPFYAISDLQYPNIQTYPATQWHAEGLEPPRYILTRIHYTRTRLLGDFQPFWSVFAKQSPMGCSALGGQGAGKPIQTFVQASACTFSPAPWSCGSCGTPKEQLNLQRTVCQE